MASGYLLVLGWLAFWVLRRSFRAGVVSPKSSVRELLPISEGCPYTYIGTVFFGIGLGFSVLRISFWLLSFGVLVIYSWAIFLGFGVF